MKGAAPLSPPMGFAELLLSLALLSSLPARDLSSAPDSTRTQLVALLQLRRENLPHALRGEIYPIALFEGDSFREAKVDGVHPLTDAAERVPPAVATPLDMIRDFTVYHQGAPIGAFRVTGVESAIYSCNAVRVGMGELDVPEEFVRFGRLDPRVQNFAVSGSGFSYEYTLNYYVALSRPVPQPDFTWDSLSDAAAARRLREAVWEAGSAALADEGTTTGDHLDPPRWSFRETFRTFDLDRDGRAEAMGVVEAAVGRGADGSDGSAPEVASAIVWAGDGGVGEPARILAVLPQAPGVSRESLRRHLAEVMDLTGDGVAEVLYQLDGIELHSFAIFALQDDALTEVFAGAEYGC